MSARSRCFFYLFIYTLFNLDYHVFNELMSMSMSMIWAYDFHVVLFLFLRGLFSTDLIGLRFKSLNAQEYVFVSLMVLPDLI